MRQSNPPRLKSKQKGSPTFNFIKSDLQCEHSLLSGIDSGWHVWGGCGEAECSVNCTGQPPLIQTGKKTQEKEERGDGVK